MQPGTRIGKRTVVQRLWTDLNGRSRLLLRCDCGREDEVYSGKLQKTQACRSCSRSELSGRHAKIVPGVRIGRRTVMERRTIGKTYKLLMRCDCGNEETIDSTAVRRRGACLECVAKERGKAIKTHCSICRKCGAHEPTCPVGIRRKKRQQTFKGEAVELEGVYCMCGEPAVEFFKGSCLCRDCLMEAD